MILTRNRFDSRQLIAVLFRHEYSKLKTQVAENSAAATTPAEIADAKSDEVAVNAIVVQEELLRAKAELKTIREHLSSVLDEAQDAFDTTGSLTEELRNTRGKLAGLQVGTDYLR